MKIALALLLLVVLPAFIEGSASPIFWGGRRKGRRPRPRPQPRPRPEKYSHCYATGDPHYKTFDNKRYDFMGVCRYVIATDYCLQPCEKPKTNFGSFKVVAENVKCGRRVSCIRSVEVTIKGETIQLIRNKYPAQRTTKTYTVSRAGGFVIVQSNPPGLMVKWNRRMSLHVSLTKKFRGKVCGLCGNFDGNPKNDFYVQGGKVALQSVRDFAQFWQAGGGRCKPGPEIPKHPCEKNPKRYRLAEKDCALIKSNHFKSCRDGKVNTQALFDNCVYDVCQEEGSDIQASCEAIKEAAEECKEQTGKTVSLGHLSKKCLACPRQARLFNSCQTKCCVFPFTWKGKTFQGCAETHFGSFCSTEKKATINSLGFCI